MSEEGRLERSLMTTYQLRYIDARKIVATGRIALGMTKWENATPQLREYCHHRLSKTFKSNSFDDSVPFDEKSTHLSEDPITSLSIEISLAWGESQGAGAFLSNSSDCKPLSTEKFSYSDISAVTAYESETDTETEASADRPLTNSSECKPRSTANTNSSESSTDTADGFQYVTETEPSDDVPLTKAFGCEPLFSERLDCTDASTETSDLETETDSSDDSSIESGSIEKSAEANSGICYDGITEYSAIAQLEWSMMKNYKINYASARTLVVEERARKHMTRWESATPELRIACHQRLAKQKAIRKVEDSSSAKEEQTAQTKSLQEEKSSVLPRRIFGTRPWRRDVLFSDTDPTVDQGPDAVTMRECRDLVEFFMPPMDLACTQGKRKQHLKQPEKPTAINNILRPWQSHFLAELGIDNGEHLMKALHRNAIKLATALCQYRKVQKMSPMSMEACIMALSIWAKTCRAFVRSIRKQQSSGSNSLVLPNARYMLMPFLEKIMTEKLEVFQ